MTDCGTEINVRNTDTESLELEIGSRQRTHSRSGCIE